MRKINKRSEPPRLKKWKSKNRTDPNYGYDLLRGDKPLIHLIEKCLSEEQGGICAYTGKQIDPDSMHIEHVFAQKHCSLDEQVSYSNMLACWPEPNHKPEPKYGAKKKGNWPELNERNDFVSPLAAGCDRRFAFNINGEIHGNDKAAKITIDRLGLYEDELKDLRKEAILEIIIQVDGNKGKVRRRLSRLAEKESALDAGGNVSLDPFCFALKRVLEAQISSVKSAKQKRK